MRARLFPAALVAGFALGAALVAAASPAIAANQTVTVGGASFVYTPQTVTIRPGDSVTWNNAGGLHNVHFDDNSFIQPPTASGTAWTTMRTLSTPGVHRYYCDAHGGPGGVGMAGVVKVSSAPLLKEASPLTVELVPAFRETISSTQCGARGGAASTHGAPDLVPPSGTADTSCNPPAYTPGTAARLGTLNTGSAQLATVPGDLVSPADEADVALTLNASDVRNRQTGGDYTPNPSGPDITVVEKLRLTDSYNGASLTTPATVIDFDFPAGVQCAATPDPVNGSACNLNSSFDAVMPGAIKEGRDMVLQTFRVRVTDSGQDQVRGNGDDRLFAQQGLFIP